MKPELPAELVRPQVGGVDHFPAEAASNLAVLVRRPGRSLFAVWRPLAILGGTVALTLNNRCAVRDLHVSIISRLSKFGRFRTWQTAEIERLREENHRLLQAAIDSQDALRRVLHNDGSGGADA